MIELKPDTSIYWQEMMQKFEEELKIACHNYDTAAMAKNNISRAILEKKMELARLAIEAQQIGNGLRMARSNVKRLELELSSAKNKFFMLQREGR